jgi:prepilin-type N-terminal cleavage/methylation domain-containing protein
MRNAFTLIELIIVIVLLGILSAVAMPKYFDLTTDAHKASAKGAQSALSVGIDLMHSKYLISKDKQGIDTWASDYPAPAAAADCASLWTAAMSSNVTAPEEVPVDGKVPESPKDFYYAFDTDTCTFYYTGTLAVGDTIADATFSLTYKDGGKVNFVDTTE